MKPLRSSYPPHTLLGGMAYVPAHRTDIRATFERARKSNDAASEHHPRARLALLSRLGETIRDAGK